MATVIYAFDNVNDDQDTKDALEQTLATIPEYKPGNTRFASSRTAPGKLYVTALFDATVDENSVESMIQQLNSFNTALGYNITVHPPKVSVIPKLSKTLYVKDVSRFLTVSEATTLTDTHDMVNVTYYKSNGSWVCELLFKKPENAERAKDYLNSQKLLGSSADVSFKF